MAAEFSVLSFARPGGLIVPIGVLLFDLNGQQLLVRCRQDWDSVAEGDDAEVLAALSDDLVQVARNLGAVKLLDYLEDTLSHSIQISTRQRIETTNVEDALDELYSHYVETGTQA